MELIIMVRGRVAGDLPARAPGLFSPFSTFSFSYLAYGSPYPDLHRQASYVTASIRPRPNTRQEQQQEAKTSLGVTEHMWQCFGVTQERENEGGEERRGEGRREGGRGTVGVRSCRSGNATSLPDSGRFGLDTADSCPPLQPLLADNSFFLPPAPRPPRPPPTSSPPYCCPSSPLLSPHASPSPPSSSPLSPSPALPSFLVLLLPYPLLRLSFPSRSCLSLPSPVLPFFYYLPFSPPPSSSPAPPSDSLFPCVLCPASTSLPHAPLFPPAPLSASSSRSFCRPSACSRPLWRPLVLLSPVSASASRPPRTTSAAPSAGQAAAVVSRGPRRSWLPAVGPPLARTTLQELVSRVLDRPPRALPQVGLAFREEGPLCALVDHLQVAKRFWDRLLATAKLLSNLARGPRAHGRGVTSGHRKAVRGALAGLRLLHGRSDGADRPFRTGSAFSSLPRSPPSPRRGRDPSGRASQGPRGLARRPQQSSPRSSPKLYSAKGRRPT
ncbi:hypothetical protein C7M84_009741 [Penaeus vannamei]|uniref:Uncharacterized protein n=1 Tax=Penaeus vannamei TaxID=6689 RepID=A0A423T5X1_PENVA|nr:hypothetical protein C7M84_009741 [Penaeus vannamei]